MCRERRGVFRPCSGARSPRDQHAAPASTLTSWRSGQDWPLAAVAGLRVVRLRGSTLGSNALPQGRITPAAPAQPSAGRVREDWSRRRQCGFHSAIQIFPVVSPMLKNSLSALSESSKKSGIRTFVNERRTLCEW